MTIRPLFRILGDMTTTTCTGTHYQRHLPSEGKPAWLLLCSGCTEATLVVGVLSVGTYATAEEAEAAYITRITEGAI